MSWAAANQAAQGRRERSYLFVWARPRTPRCDGRSATNPPPDHRRSVRPGARDFPIDHLALLVDAPALAQHGHELLEPAGARLGPARLLEAIEDRVAVGAVEPREELARGRIGVERGLQVGG